MRGLSSGLEGVVLALALLASSTTKQVLADDILMSKKSNSINGNKGSVSLVGGVVIFTTAADGRIKNPALIKSLESAGLCVSQVRLAAGLKDAEAGRAVATAVNRLAARCGDNGDRIGVIAQGAAANAAVLGSRAEWRVRSFVLLSGRLSARAKDLLTDWHDNPSLCIASTDNKPALRDMTDVYFSSKHPDSDIKVLDATDSKTSPETDEVTAGLIAGWVRHGLTAVGRAREVSFPTEDGWEIFGNLVLPDPDPSGKKAPGVILLHSGRSDRFVFSDMERMLIRAGFAVLNIDWRGRGKSVNKGRYFDLSKQERFNGLFDAKASINYLAAQPGVNADGIGLVGIIHGAEHAVRASIGDPRVKSLALLTGYMPVDERESSYLTSGNVHVMYVSCTGHKQVSAAMQKLYAASSDKLTRFVMFEGGAIGYQLFELDEKFERMIVDWLKEGLMK